MQGYAVGAPPGLLRVFRVLSLITAIANAGGNVLLLLFHRPIFALLGVPPPIDVPSFAFVSGFSFTIGVLAFLIFRAAQVSTDLLVTGIVAKSIYSLFTFYFYTIGELHWLYRFFGIWDGVFALIFFFFLIYLVSPDLNVLNAGAILPGAERARGRSALLLYYSLTGLGASACRALRSRAGRRSAHGATRSGSSCASRRTGGGSSSTWSSTFPRSTSVFMTRGPRAGACRARTSCCLRSRGWRASSRSAAPGVGAGGRARRPQRAVEQLDLLGAPLLGGCQR
ncbi:hypothetical protein [Sorangium sp. So ce124]|uniref:hypothetical protein n=1 Tax=Sorangium sp. So ce124 TaxID=3133280 RepID=UPI003F639787